MVEEGRPQFEINVDGEPIPFDKLDIDFDCDDEPAPALKSHQLVLEKWCRNSIDTLELSDGFDLSKLELSTEDYILPTGANKESGRTLSTFTSSRRTERSSK